MGWCGTRRGLGSDSTDGRGLAGMKIVSIGGGPAGLYLAILMKKADPAHDITVIERNRADDTFGFGVVFSDATLDELGEADAQTYAEIRANFAHWDDIDIHYQGEVLTSTGHGFSGLSRLEAAPATAAEYLAEQVVGIEAEIPAPAATPAGIRALPAHGRALGPARVDFARVVAPLLGGVAQDLVRRRDFLELRCGARVARVQIGMKLLREFAKSVLDLLGGGVALDAKHFIGIARHGCRPEFAQWARCKPPER